MLTEKFTKILIIIGTILIIIGIIMFITVESFTEIGQLGDFIGGVSGSIWALAGVILFYLAFQSQKDALNDQKIATQATIDAVQKQSEALKLQTEEIALQREELSKSTEAQNKSQIALNHQLKSMQLTSQIDILNQYLNLIKNKNRADHEKVSNEIILYLTNQIFYNPEYEEIVKPKFILHTKSINKVGSNDQIFNHEIKLQLLNTSVKELKVEGKDPSIKINFRSINSRVSENAIFEFSFTAEKGNKEFELQFVGIVVPNKFKQIINVQFDDIYVNEIEYIENVYEK